MPRKRTQNKTLYHTGIYFSKLTEKNKMKFWGLILYKKNFTTVILWDCQIVGFLEIKETSNGGALDIRYKDILIL